MASVMQLFCDKWVSSVLPMLVVFLLLPFERPHSKYDDESVNLCMICNWSSVICTCSQFSSEADWVHLTYPWYLCLYVWSVAWRHDSVFMLPMFNPWTFSSCDLFMGFSVKHWFRWLTTFSPGACGIAVDFAVFPFCVSCVIYSVLVELYLSWG